MPDSEAVYQPTTVGYSYETEAGGFLGDGTLLSRHKIFLKKWANWALLFSAICILAAGVIVIAVDLASTDYADVLDEGAKDQETTTRNPSTDGVDPAGVPKDNGNSSGRTIAVGISLIFIGLLLGSLWAFFRFFHRAKSPRNESSGGGGQMLGGLNPSTDLLVGSPSQYGPVLTEVPTHPKLKESKNHENVAATLSDQEEETRTLMQDPPTFSVNRANAVDNHLPV